jgi:hypothetical protein
MAPLSPKDNIEPSNHLIHHLLPTRSPSPRPRPSTAYDHCRTRRRRRITKPSQCYSSSRPRRRGQSGDDVGAPTASRPRADPDPEPEPEPETERVREEALAREDEGAMDEGGAVVGTRVPVDANADADTEDGALLALEAGCDECC